MPAVLEGIKFWLSPGRRRFMRRLARTGLDKFNARLNAAGSPQGIAFISTLLRANADFLAFALSTEGPLADCEEAATAERVEQCMASLLIYAVNVFARGELANNESELIGLLAHVLGFDEKKVMLRRDMLRKAPRSEEWMLYTWLVADLGQKQPAYSPELERALGYQYLSYIGQFRPLIERRIARRP